MSTTQIRSMQILSKYSRPSQVARTLRGNKILISLCKMVAFAQNGRISIAFMISKITSCYKPRTINLSEIRILIGQFKFIAYLKVSSSQSDNLPHNGVNVKEAQFNYKGPSLQHCLQYESYGIWLKGMLYQLETKNCLLRYVSTLYNEDISYSINLSWCLLISCLTQALELQAKNAMEIMY